MRKKFEGVLIASDYDNTMVFTESALRSGGDMPHLSAGNRAAIEYFMAQGGTFSVATGRALPAFDAVRRGLPMNGPTVLFNGAAIYDYAKGAYLYTAFLPEAVRGHVEEVLAAYPRAACEIYHDDNTIHALQPNALTARHEHLTHSPTQTAASMAEIPSPISKALFEIDAPELAELERFVRSRPWAGGYEIIPSSNYLLELTVKGANKGGMVEKLAQLLDIERAHVYCVGDHANDIPMLRFSRIPFAPANAIESVLQLPGLHRLPDCREDAIAAMIGEIDALY